VTLGDSDKAEVGDWVVAVGNPFGLGGTVTAGIISARGRDIHSGPYDDFLQIDASINRGNSGGPLFDLTGNVIGVNTAIYSPNGGSVGIGFAIPSSLVKMVVADLKDDGKVDRGWLGVSIQPVTPDLAESLGMDKAQGALIAEVVPDGPAAKAGLRQRDVVLSVGDTPIEDVRTLVRHVATLPQGHKVDIAVWRDGAKRDIDVTVGATPSEQVVASADKTESKVAPTARLGLAVAPMTDEAKARYGIKDATSGVVVVDVSGDGPAAEAGLRPGDVIVKAGDKTIENPQALSQAVDSAATASKKSVLLMVERQGQPLFVAVRLAKA
jgi:serine protease Do